MIDDLATRAALTVAAFLLLGSGLSVVSLSEEGMISESFRNLASNVARAIDEISRIEAAMTVRFGGDEDAAVSLPTTLSGHPYRLELRATEIRIVGALRTAVEFLRTRIYLSPAPLDAYSDEKLTELDGTANLVLGSGEPFSVVRAPVLVEGRSTFLTFVRLP